MIIHNPIVSGSLTFANNATLTSAESSITGSFKGDLLSTNGIVSSSNQVTSLLPTGVISGSSQLPSGTVSGSSQITITESQISDLSHYTDSNVKTKLNTETVISGSSQVVLNSANKTGFDTADVAENASYLYYTDARVKTKLNTEGVISSSVEGSSQGQIDFNGSAIDVNNLGTGDSPTFANLTLTGDLSVQGTTTTVNSTTVNIGDNIINLNYGGSSTTGGIYVKDGTGASTTSGSLLWDSTNDYWKAGKLGTEQKILLENGDGVLSGSAQVVSLLPAGTISGSSQVNINSTTGTLTTLGTVTSGDVTAILPSGVISGSAQVGVNNSTITLNTAGGLIGGGSITLNQASDETITFTIAGGIISGSSQVNADSITNFDSNVKAKLNADTVISGSSQVNINSTTGTLTTLGTVTSGDVTAILPSGVISGSAQIEGNFLEVNGDNVVSSSAQIDALGFLKVDGDNVISSSAQLTGIFDSRYLNTNGDGVISGSSQVVLNSADKTGFDTDDVTEGSTNQYYTDARVKTKLNTEGVISGSSQVNADSITNFDSNVKDKLNTEGVISSSAQLADDFLDQFGEGTFSGSSQVDHDQTTNFVANEHIDHTSVTITGGNGLTGGGDISTSRTINVASANNGIVVNADNIQLNTGGSTFTDGVKAKLNAEGVISGSAQVNADSITNFDSNVKDKLNTDGIISSSAQVNADTIQQFDANVQDVLNTDGVISGSTQVIASDTFNFDTAVTNVMDGATVISGSDQVTSSLDSRYVNSTGNETISGNKTFSNNVIVSGDLTVAGTTTTTSTNNVIVGDNIIDLNYGGGATDGGLYVTDVTVSGLETGSLLWDGVQNRWVAGVKNSEIKILLAEGDGIISSSAQLTDTFLEINGDNVVSGSSQISADQTDGWADDVKTQLDSQTVISSSAQLTDTFLQIDGQGVISGSSQITITESQISDLSHYTDADVKTKLNAEGVISSSAQVTITESQISDLTHYTDSDVKTKLNNDNVVSGSNQIDGTGITNNTINIAGTSTALGGSITAAKILEGTGTISGSSQLTNVATDFGTGRVSGNNIGNLSGTTTFTGSFVGDGSSLSGVTSYTDADTLSYINSRGVVSGSSQIDVTSTTNYGSINQYSDSKVKTYLDSQTVISGSSQITITESQISDLDHYTDSDVKTKLNAEGVFSSSAQIEGNFLEVNGDNVVSSSAQISSYNVFLEKNGDNVVSGSGQLSNVFLSKDGDGVISSSAQLTGTFDSRYLNVNGDNVVSGAAQLYTDLDARYGNEEGEGLISSSAQIQGFGIFAELNGDGLISGSAQLTDTFLEINGDGVHSGSAQVVSSLVSATGISSGNKTTIQSNLGVDAAGTKNSTDVTLAGSYDYITAGGTDNQTLTLGQVDASTDISNLTTTNVSEGTNKYYTDARVKTKLNAESVISSSAQITITESQISDLDHYTDSDWDTRLATKSTTNLSEGTNLYYTDARVKTKLNTEGVVSGSSQISLSGFDTDDISEGSSNLYYTDTRVRDYIRSIDVISGSATQVRTFLNVENGADVTDAANVTSGLVAATGISAGNKTTIQSNLGVDAAGTKNSTDVTLAGSYNYITAGGTDNQTLTLNQVDASTDISNLTTSNVSEGTNKYYTDAKVKTKLNAEGVISGSSQITITESQISDLDHYTDSDWDSRLATKSTTNLSEGTNLYYTDARVKTKLNAEGVISGSSQITITESQISDLDHYTDSDWDTRLATKSTDNLSEGSTNKYASTANVKTALNANLGTLTLGDSNDTISIPGNLTVSGTTNFVNSNTLNIGDNNIVLNADVTGTPTQNGGITIERGTETNATLLWDETNDYWKAGLSGAEVQIALVNGTYSGLRAQSTTKSDVGLGNVENTALSTWGGSTNITTLGTITDGTWQGNTISDDYISSAGTWNAKQDALTFGIANTNAVKIDSATVADNDYAKFTASGLEGRSATEVKSDLGITSGDISDVDAFSQSGTYANLRAQATTKGDVGLGSVENTALSTWAGSTNITTLGTISSGTWQGTAIADAYLSSNTAHLSGTQTFSGAKTFSAAVNITDSTASTSKTTGALKVTGGVGISGALNVGGDVVAYASSDERLKDNIELISNPIEKVQSLKGVTWNWNESADELQQSLPNVGVIAQDVEKVLPQLVTDRDNGFKGVDYAKLTGLLIEAIKEQQKQIDELKSKLQ